MSGTGLLELPVVEEARRIVFGRAIEAEDRPILQAMAKIDSAHVVMLVATGNIVPDVGCLTLAAIAGLEEEEFASLVGVSTQRGLYMAYEAALIGRAGPVAADTHLARSRNDLNATIFAIALRHEAARYLRALLRLRRALIASANHFADVTMPMFSHHRPGMPGTWAHYLTGAERALRRDSEDVIYGLQRLRRCPMGAGAGAGTVVPLDTTLTARLLGFEGGPEHALDAVSSRDLGLRILLAAAVASTSASRIASDLLIWSGDLEAIWFPDELVGSSSIMPQKRNAFLLEHITGKAGVIIGQAVLALAAAHGTAFANCVAVGTESIAPIHAGLRNAFDIASLLALMVEGAVPDRDNFAAASKRGMVGSTALAIELRKRTGMSYREAHHLIGRKIRDAGAAARTSEVARDLNVPGFPSDEAPELALGQRYGGGPGETGSVQFLESLLAQIESDEAVVNALEANWLRADEALSARKQAIVTNGG